MRKQNIRSGPVEKARKRGVNISERGNQEGPRHNIGENVCRELHCMNGLLCVPEAGSSLIKKKGKG